MARRIQPASFDAQAFSKLKDFKELISLYKKFAASGLLDAFLPLLKEWLAISAPWDDEVALKQRLEIIKKAAELLAKLTDTQVDDSLVSVISSALDNPVVLAILKNLLLKNLMPSFSALETEAVLAEKWQAQSAVGWALLVGRVIPLILQLIQLLG